MTFISDSIAFHHIAQYMPAHHVHMVSDANTFAACAFDALPEWIDRHCQYDASPVATAHAAIELAQASRGCSALLAVGSGTINDICKYAAHLLHVPYAVIATAPSMNGYVSPNASLKLGKHKESIEASAPVAVFFDDAILADAPKRLIQAGLGDTLCLATVQADAMLAHYLAGAESYEALFETMHEDEAVLLKALEKEEGATTFLMQALLGSGKAMALAGSSAPASQGEHMIAHLLDMMIPELSHYYHGEVIAVTTMTMARLWQQATTMAGQPVSRKAFPFAALESRFGTMQTLKWQRAYEEKWAQVLPTAVFPDMSAWIPDAQRLEALLKGAGCPTSCDELNVNEDIYNESVIYAAFTRNRFTLLDMMSFE